MRSLFAFVILLSALALLSAGRIEAASDPTVDRLIKKLPPPEKLARHQMAADPAQSDPFAHEMMAAAQKDDFGRALKFARKLSQKYPKSAAAQFVHGLLALSQQKFAESAKAHRAAIVLEPKLVLAYLGLATAEASQEHFAVALSAYQQITRLEPKAEVGWLGSSSCAEELGRPGESLAYAKRATAVAPSSSVAWLQLSRAEKASGNHEASQKALKKSNDLWRAENKSAQKKKKR